MGGGWNRRGEWVVLIRGESEVGVGGVGGFNPRCDRSRVRGKRCVACMGVRCARTPASRLPYGVA